MKEEFCTISYRVPRKTLRKCLIFIDDIEEEDEQQILAAAMEKPVDITDFINQAGANAEKVEQFCIVLSVAALTTVNTEFKRK